MSKLSDSEVQESLASLDDWRVEGGALKKDFKFADFARAMEFMNKLAAEAERLNHHPDWSNSYNKVSISLTTHGDDGLSGLDFELAHSAERIAGDM